MKKTLALLVMAVMTLAATAQKVQCGLKVGMNLSTESAIKVEDLKLDNNKFKTAVHAAFVVNIPISEKFEIEPSLMYSMQGYKGHVYKLDDIVVDDDENVSSHYLMLPIAAKMYVHKGLYVEVGPQFGYLLKKKGAIANFLDIVYTDNGLTKNFDFAVFGGVGYKFNNGVFVEGRYSHGLTETSKLFKGAENRNIMASVGYLF